MVAVLDTNIVVDYLRNSGNIKSMLEQYSEICLPSIVCGELLFGASVSSNPVKNRDKVVEFIDRCRVLTTDFNVASEYAKIRQHLQAKGKPIDIWIAANALAYGLVLITRDQHFAQIEFLAVEFWN